MMQIEPRWIIVTLFITIAVLIFSTKQQVLPKPEVSIKQSLNPTETLTPEPKNSLKTYITYYGWADNSPPGKGVAYPNKKFPNALHDQAGGTGTYEDPITFASDPDEWKVGTILYVPYIKKYIIMEDLCNQCSENWKEGRRHIDIWIESNESFEDKLIKCENHWTRRSTQVIFDPSPDYSVDLTPFFDPNSGDCN